MPKKNETMTWEEFNTVSKQDLEDPKTGFEKRINYIKSVKADDIYKLKINRPNTLGKRLNHTTVTEEELNEAEKLFDSIFNPMIEFVNKARKYECSIFDDLGTFEVNASNIGQGTLVVSPFMTQISGFIDEDDSHISDKGIQRHYKAEYLHLLAMGCTANMDFSIAAGDLVLPSITEEAKKEVETLERKEEEERKNAALAEADQFAKAVETVNKNKNEILFDLTLPINDEYSYKFWGPRVNREAGKIEENVTKQELEKSGKAFDDIFGPMMKEKTFSLNHFVIDGQKNLYEKVYHDLCKFIDKKYAESGLNKKELEAAQDNNVLKVMAENVTKVIILDAMKNSQVKLEYDNGGKKLALETPQPTEEFVQFHKKIRQKRNAETQSEIKKLTDSGEFVIRVDGLAKITDFFKDRYKHPEYMDQGEYDFNHYLHDLYIDMDNIYDDGFKAFAVRFENEDGVTGILNLADLGKQKHMSPKEMKAFVAYGLATGKVEVYFKPYTYDEENVCLPPKYIKKTAILLNDYVKVVAAYKDDQKKENAAETVTAEKKNVINNAEKKPVEKKDQNKDQKPEVQNMEEVNSVDDKQKEVDPKAMQNENKPEEKPVEVKQDVVNLDDKKDEVKPEEMQNVAKADDSKVEAKADDKKDEVETEVKQDVVNLDDKKDEVKPEENQNNVKPEENQNNVKPEEIQNVAKAEDNKNNVNPEDNKDDVKPLENEGEAKPEEENQGEQKPELNETEKNCLKSLLYLEYWKKDTRELYRQIRTTLTSPYKDAEEFSKKAPKDLQRLVVLMKGFEDYLDKNRSMHRYNLELKNVKSAALEYVQNHTERFISHRTATSAERFNQIEYLVALCDYKINDLNAGYGEFQRNYIELSESKGERNPVSPTFNMKFGAVKRRASELLNLKPEELEKQMDSEEFMKLESKRQTNAEDELRKRLSKVSGFTEDEIRAIGNDSFALPENASIKKKAAVYLVKTIIDEAKSMNNLNGTFVDFRKTDKSVFSKRLNLIANNKTFQMLVRKSPDKWAGLWEIDERMMEAKKEYFNQQIKKANQNLVGYATEAYQKINSYDTFPIVDGQKSVNDASAMVADNLLGRVLTNPKNYDLLSAYVLLDDAMQNKILKGIALYVNKEILSGSNKNNFAQRISSALNDDLLKDISKAYVEEKLKKYNLDVSRPEAGKVENHQENANGGNAPEEGKGGDKPVRSFGN